MVENFPFYSLYYRQISFRRLVEVLSFPTRCLVCSEITPIMFGDHKRAGVAIFACFRNVLKNCFKNQQKSHIKKSFLTNKTVRLEVREKNFEITLEFKICSGRLLQVHGYLQKQTGWSYDAQIDFYCDKREQLLIFKIWYC